MVPNSLGPAELLLHYGTPEAKQPHLPRLARGDEIPAFALTSPWAGSDAASIPDAGVVCKGIYQGREVLGMRVNFDKRYITLAPVYGVRAGLQAVRPAAPARWRWRISASPARWCPTTTQASPSAGGIFRSTRCG